MTPVEGYFQYRLDEPCGYGKVKPAKEDIDNDDGSCGSDHPPADTFGNGAGVGFTKHCMPRKTILNVEC